MLLSFVSRACVFILKLLVRSGQSERAKDVELLVVRP